MEYHSLRRDHIVKQEFVYELHDGELRRIEAVAETEIDRKKTYHCDCGESFRKEETAIQHLKEAQYD